MFMINMIYYKERDRFNIQEMRPEVLQNALQEEEQAAEGLEPQEEAKPPIAVPSEQEDDGTMGEQQVEHVEQVQLDLCLCLFLFLSLAVEEEEVQRAAEPTERADDYTEQQEEPEKDRRYSHSVAVVVAAQAEACASYEHDVESDVE